MKTKVLHKQKKKIDSDKNLLNNQNYILWKTEKKKLLSKFFVEKNMKHVLNLFNMVSYFIKKFLFVIFLIFLLFIAIKTIDIIYIDGSISLLIVPIFLLAILIYFLSWNNISKINTIGDYFINSEVYNSDDNSYLSHKFINIFTPPLIFGSIFYFSLYFEFLILTLGYIFIWYFFTIIVIPLILAYFFEKIMTWLNYINLLFFPLLLIYQIVYFVFSVIYTFLLKREKWFHFIKYKPITQFFNKFKNIKSKSAKNKYYKIVEK